MSANFHPLVYLIDYVMGVIMWTLIGRVAMNIFQKEDSNFFFMKDAINKIYSNWRSLIPLGIMVNKNTACMLAVAKSCFINGTVCNSRISHSTYICKVIHSKY